MNLQSHIPWQDGKSLKEATSHLYTKPTLSDVKFTFSKEVNVSPVPAHKFILAMRSSEFENMFYNSGSSPSTVDITDIKREMFLSFLKFLYTDEIILKNKNVSSIFHLSYKYQVTQLANLCQQYLLDNITPSTACTIMEISGSYKLSTLQTKCLSYIEENTSAILQDKNWHSLSLENLKLLLSKDELSSSEKEIFEAVMRWASEKCKRQGVNDTGTNRRDVLGDVLYQIRIPTMSLEDYSQVVIKTGVLTDSEQLAIFKHLASASAEPVQNFVTKPRRDRQFIIEFQSNFVDPVLWGGKRESLNIEINFKSNKMMKAVVVDLTKINTECPNTDGYVNYGSPCLVLGIQSSKEKRKITVTENKGPITAIINPPIRLIYPDMPPKRGKSSHREEVEFSLWRNDCSICREKRCRIFGKRVNGQAQGNDIHISFSGLDLVKSITFSNRSY